MARRILNRKDLRADFDAAERRKDEDETEETDEEAEDDDEDEESEGGDEEEADDEAAAEGEGDDEEEETPKKKKKKAPPKVKVKPKAKPRARTPKVIRMRVVWGVFNNSNQCVATYEYPKKTEAAEHAAKLTADKRNTHFVQPVKEPIEEKKEK